MSEQQLNSETKADLTEKPQSREETTSAQTDRASMKDREAFGEAHAETIIARMGALLAELESYSSRKRRAATGEANPLGWALDALIGRGLNELPALAPAATTGEACAAFGYALFGPEVVPDPRDGEDMGSHLMLAFQTTAALLATGKQSIAINLFVAAALAVHRAQQEEKEAGRKQADGE
jgi:hypothetical protein